VTGFERDIRKDRSARRLTLDVARTLDIYSSNNPMPLGMMCATDSSLVDKVHALITLELLNGWNLSLVDSAMRPVWTVKQRGLHFPALSVG